MFRRNRTLSGSSSHVVNSATTTGDERSPRAKVHVLARMRRKIGVLLGGTLVGAIVIGGLVYQLTAQVVVSTSSGIALTEVQTKRYSDAIQSYYGSHPLERLRFALNQDDLATYMRVTTPEVADIRMGSGAGLGKTDFTLTFRQPTAGWVIGNKQYYVDANGVPFDTNYYAMPLVQIVDQTGIQQQSGVAIVSNRFLAFVGKLVGALNTKGLTVEKVIIPAGTTHQLQLTLKDKSYYIKVSLDRSVGEQVEDIGRVTGYFDSKGETPQYIDVRVQGRAYYRD